MQIKGMSLLVIATLLVSGCSHQLQVKNLHLYQAESVDSPAVNSRVGITGNISSLEDNRMVHAIADSLKKNGFRVVQPYYANQNSEPVDYVINVSTLSEYKGSGWNFLINFPGFLIFTPAWHGYNYKADFDYNVDITKTQNNEKLPRLSVPVHMDIRHAAMNRTWTEISWVEFGAIALIGGIVFIRYDNNVTPLLIDKTEYKIGDYVAGKITKAIIAAS